MATSFTSAPDSARNLIRVTVRSSGAAPPARTLVTPWALPKSAPLALAAPGLAVPPTRDPTARMIGPWPSAVASLGLAPWASSSLTTSMSPLAQAARNGVRPRPTPLSRPGALKNSA